MNNEKIPIPISPVIHAALKAIYAGKSGLGWNYDSVGRPYFKYETRAGKIVLFCTPPPDYANQFNPEIARFYSPRLNYVYSGKLRRIISDLSVETADIFLILISQIAKLRNPADSVVKISLEEIAEYRHVYHRHGSPKVLYSDFKKEILRLADLRLSMRWKNYWAGGEIIIGYERPDTLLDILAVGNRMDNDSPMCIRFRCGQGLSHFLDPKGLFWIGYYSRILLHLSPYHDALTKKIGTYWILVGTISQKKGQLPRATPETIMDFCGQHINWRNSGQTVNSFILAHQKLEDIGILENSPAIEPDLRDKGYFRDWLISPISVKLSENLWEMKKSRKSGGSKLIKKNSIKIADKNHIESKFDLMKNPHIIKQFRRANALRQHELAKSLRITRQTLSRYEKGLTRIPESKAIMLLEIYKRFRNS